MPDSTSPTPKGFVLDTNVLSLLAKAGQLALLKTAILPLYITPAIQFELEAGVHRGVNYLADALQLIDNGAVHIIANVDNRFMHELPAKLGKGEVEAIAACRQANLVLITHDRKAINYCERQQIDCVPLLDLLYEYEIAGLITPAEIDRILAQ
ncbi:MAG: hypothetical protein R2911_29660 [Caldilineaceae bacterium]